MTLKELQLKYLKVLFLGQLLVEALDDIEQTPLYKQRLKYLAKNTSNELLKILNVELPKVMSQDQEFATNMFQQIDYLITKLATLSMEELPMVNKLVDEFKEDPKYWKEKLILEFNKVQV
jgi:hypothetical protein